MRSIRRFAVTAILFAGFIVPWFNGYGRTDSLIRVVIGCVVWGVGEIELRLKTMQVRLAGMDDKLHRLIGDEDHRADDDLILELNDW